MRDLIKISSLLILLCAVPVRSCGITTHIEIGERAATLFDITSQGVNYGQLIRKHAGSFEAGTVYPDSFYSNICFAGRYHSVSEDSHWTPFINASVNYIRRSYPRPWSTAGEQLVVFLLGVVSHQVADVLWHSLDVHQGFLQTMAAMNYHGVYSDAHNAGDFGGDVINGYSLDNSQKSLIRNWNVPVRDLVKIYKELYDSDVISAYVIRLCSYTMYLGRFGEQTGAIDLLYPVYSANSPFLLDRLYSYFLGGMSDMAVWSATTWNRTIAMLDYGTEECSLPKNPLFIRCAGEREAVDWWPEERSLLSPHLGHASHMLHRSSQIRTRRQLKKSKNSNDVTQLSNYSLLVSTQPYSELGYCTVVGDVNSDGFNDVLISAPSYSVDTRMYIGKVFALLGTSTGLYNKNGTIEQISNFSLTGLHSGGRYGESMVVLDMNVDGFKDVVISSPSVGREELMYSGQIYLYLSTGGHIPSVPTVVIRCLLKHCNFGMSLGKGDVNGDGHEDLLVGSPMAPGLGIQRGMLQVLYSNSYIGMKKKILTELDMNHTWFGKQDFEWFGYSHIFKRFKTASLLVIGAPAYRKCFKIDCSYSNGDKEIMGRVYVFSNLNNEIEISFPSSIIEGTDSFQQFGSFVNIFHWEKSTYVLSVSSTTANETSISKKPKVIQPGKVDFFNLTNMQKISTISSNESLSRFGQSIIDTKDFLFVAAPLLSTKKREIGAISVYKKTFLNNYIRSVSLLDDYARFASSIAILNPNQTTSGNNKSQLIVGAPLYTSDLARHSGAVVITTV